MINAPRKSAFLAMFVLICIFSILSESPAQNPIHVFKDKGTVGAISDSSDGALLAIGYDGVDSKPGYIVLWNMKTGKAVRKLKGHMETAGLCFSKDNKFLISAGFADAMQVCRVSTGEVVFTKKKLTALTSLVQIGRTGLIATYEKKIRLWDITNPVDPNRLKNPSNLGACSQFEFSPDGKRVIMAINDGLTWIVPMAPPEVRVWDIPKGKLLRRFSGKKSNNVVCMNVSPTGDCIALGYFFGRANIEIRSMNKDKVVFSGSCFPYAPGALSFSPDGKYIASGSCFGGEIKVWDIGAKLLKKTFGAHKGSIQWLKFSADGERLLSAGADNLVKVWRTADFK